MRDEVRAEYEAALASVSGDDAFAVRFERFFTELRDPLVALYGDDPRFAAAFARAAARGRARPPRRARASCGVLDHEREVTPDWLQREQAVGYVTYVDRFAGTLAGVRERLPYLRELGVTYLHLMPLLHARPAPNDGGYAVRRLRRGRARRWGRWRTCARWPPTCARHGMALCVDLVLNHVAAEHPWARDPAFYPHVPGPLRARRVRADAARRVPRHRARAASPGRGRPLDLDDVQHLPVGPRLHEPGGVRGDGAA